MNISSERPLDSSLPSLGVKADASFRFGFPNAQMADDFRVAVEDSISGVGTEIDGEEVRINTDIDSFSSLAEKLNRIRKFVISTTRPVLRTSLGESLASF